MEYPDYLTEIQKIAYEFMPNEQKLTSEGTDELGNRLLALDLVNPNTRKKGYHQTVACYRDKNVWVPVTVHFQTNEEGRINYVRIHTPNYVREYGKEQF